MLLPLLQEGKVLFYFSSCCCHCFLLKIVQHLLYTLFFVLLLGKYCNGSTINDTKLFYDLAHEAVWPETSDHCQVTLKGCLLLWGHVCLPNCSILPKHLDQWIACCLRTILQGFHLLVAKVGHYTRAKELLHILI